MSQDQPSLPETKADQKTARVSLGKLKTWLATQHTVVKDYMQVFAILAAATWAVYQFYYVEIYKPNHTRPPVEATATFEELDRNDLFITLIAKVTYHNKGIYPVHVLSAFFNIEGNSVETLKSDADSYRQRVETAALSGKDVYTPRYLVMNRKTLIASGSIMDRWVLQPGEAHTEAIVIHVPTDLPEVDLIVGKFRVNVARDITFLNTKWLVEDDEYKGRLCVVSQANSEDLAGCKLLNKEEVKIQEKLCDRYGIGGTLATSHFPLRRHGGKPSIENSVQADAD